MATKPAKDKKVDDEKPADELAPKKSNKALFITAFVVFILSVSASSGVAFFLLSPKESASSNDQLAQQEQLLTNLQESLKQQEVKINAIEEQNETLKLYLRHSSATALKNILIDQEQNIQAYLKVMKSAIGDFSALIPRTTDWNNEYQYQLDLALKGSMKREDLLKLLKTGEPNDTPPQL